MHNVANDTTTSNHPTWEQLLQFANGSLEVDQSNWIESHVAACETCCHQLENAPEDALAQLLKKSPHEHPTTGLRLVTGFQILDELGRGGMGVVYRAVQPALNRQVAIKMIGKSSQASKLELTRFRLEAEASAALNHPNIVQVYDVGEIDGQPYIAMELVQGGTLSEYLQRRPLEYKEATLLMIELTQAVQHAHSSGIVHRDLKPSNILLVSSREESASASLPKPKIADFGLAKRIDLSAGVSSSGNILGTPSYMSPEQIVGDTKLVGPPADVYSLGAVLYETLVGRPPFKGANAIETIALVKSTNPVRPSTLRAGFPKDLETICLKCLEKSTSDRYPSAKALLDDLERFRDGRPILAKPASLARRSLDWSKRHPTLCASIAASIFAVVGVISVGLVYNASLQRALQTAKGERSRANDNFQVAFQSVEQMLDRVGFAQLAQTPEMEDVREKLLSDAVAFYSKLLEGQPDADVESRRQYYRALFRLGQIQWTLGQQDSALKSLGDSIDLQKKLVDQAPDRHELQHELAASYITKSQITQDKDDYQMSIRLLEAIVNDYPVCKIDLAQAVNNLAIATPSMEQREKLHLRAQELRKELLANSPSDAKLQYSLAETQHNLAFLYFTTGRKLEAEAAYRDALQMFETLAKNHQSVTDYHRALAECLAHMANMAHSAQRPEEAIELIRRAISTSRLLAARFPKIPSMREAVTRGLSNEAAFQIAASRFDQASLLAEEAVKIASQLKEEFPGSHYQFIEANSLTIWATALSGGLKMQAAQAAFERASTIYDELLIAEPENTDLQSEAGVQFMNYSNVLRPENPARAAQLNDRSVALLEQVFEKFPQRTDVHSYLFNAHGARASSYEAMSNFQQAISSWSRALELAPPERKVGMGLLRALSMARAGQIDSATEAADVLLQNDNLQGSDLYNLACVFGLLYQSSKKSADSSNSNESVEHLCQRAIELLNHPQTLEFLSNPINRQQLMVDNDLEMVRANPKFHELIDKIATAD